MVTKRGIASQKVGDSESAPHEEAQLAYKHASKLDHCTSSYTSVTLQIDVATLVRWWLYRGLQWVTEVKL